MKWNLKLSLLFVFLCLLLTSCGSEEEKSSSTRNGIEEAYPDNWDELCAITDCEQFPVGYRTYKIGDINLHYPTSAPSLGFVLSSEILGSSVNRYTQRDSAGKIIRAYYPFVRSIDIRGCCKNLFELKSDGDYRLEAQIARDLDVQRRLIEGTQGHAQPIRD